MSSPSDGSSNPQSDRQSVPQDTGPNQTPALGGVAQPDESDAGRGWVRVPQAWGRATGGWYAVPSAEDRTSEPSTERT